MKEPHIKKLSQKNLSEYPKGKTDWNKLRQMSEAEIVAARKSDAYFRDIDWDEANIELIEPIQKKPVSIRLDSDVIEFFKQSGRGYQTRINQVLRDFMEHKLKA